MVDTGAGGADPDQTNMHKADGYILDKVAPQTSDPAASEHRGCAMRRDNVVVSCGSRAGNTFCRDRSPRLNNLGQIMIVYMEGGHELYSGQLSANIRRKIWGREWEWREIGGG